MQDVTIGEWLDSLAAKTPTPGGGASAALTTAIAAAQLRMVTAYTTGPKWQDREDRMGKVSEELVVIQGQALALVQKDATAFAGVGDAYRLPKENEAQKIARQTAIQQAITLAAEPPCETALLATQLIGLAGEIAISGNPNVISDVAVTASIAKAALESAIVNIQINEHSLTNEAVKQSLLLAIQEATLAAKQANKVVELVSERIATK